MNVGNLVLSQMELFIGQTPQTEDSIIYGSKGFMTPFSMNCLSNKNITNYICKI
jgi:hypothetical protein